MEQVKNKIYRKMNGFDMEELYSGILKPLCCEQIIGVTVFYFLDEGAKRRIPRGQITNHLSHEIHNN